jgi:hypothetical protein
MRFDELVPPARDFVSSVKSGNLSGRSSDHCFGRFFFTMYPKMLDEHAGTVYLAPIADSTGQPVEAGKTYKVRVPKDVPARQFWSLTVYERATWAFINNPSDRAGLGSFNMDQMQKNADGSVDVYIGPTRASRSAIQLDSDTGQGALQSVELDPGWCWFLRAQKPRLSTACK